MLYLSDENKEFLEEWKVRELIKKYSNYVWVPIMMRAYDSRSEEEKKKEPKVMDFEQVNESTPIWKKAKSEIQEKDYEEFYKTISNDWNKPLFILDTQAEWLINYRAILFSPKEVSMYLDLTNPNIEYWPKLYTQNVLLLEHAKELVPVWLRFISWLYRNYRFTINVSKRNFTVKSFVRSR